MAKPELMTGGQPTQAPQAAAPISSPAKGEAPAKSERYRVKGPGGLFYGANSALHAAGSIVTMQESDALSVIDLLEPVE